MDCDIADDGLANLSIEELRRKFNELTAPVVNTFICGRFEAHRYFTKKRLSILYEIERRTAAGAGGY